MRESGIGNRESSRDSRLVARDSRVFVLWLLASGLWRVTRNRTALPMTGLSPTITSATSCSFASLVRRTATWRESGGGLSSTTRLNAPLRNRMSAHQALLSAPCGRIIQSRPLSPASAHSRGARVRDPSITATHRRASTAACTTCLTSVVRPLPRAPWISVSRPLGTPPSDSARSSASIPVGIATPSPPTRGGGRIAASCWRRAETDTEDRGQRPEARGEATTGPGA